VRKPRNHNSGQTSPQLAYPSGAKAAPVGRTSLTGAKGHQCFVSSVLLLMAMRLAFSWALAVFGIVTVSTPSLNEA
jgi:hypothetical protein